MDDREPQIVYCAKNGDDIEVYCDVGKVRHTVTIKLLNDLVAAISLLNSVGCNISLRHVER